MSINIGSVYCQPSFNNIGQKTSIGILRIIPGDRYAEVTTLEDYEYLQGADEYGANVILHFDGDWQQPALEDYLAGEEAQHLLERIVAGHQVDCTDHESGDLDDDAQDAADNLVDKLNAGSCFEISYWDAEDYLNYALDDVKANDGDAALEKMAEKLYDLREPYEDILGGKHAILEVLLNHRDHLLNN